MSPREYTGIEYTPNRGAVIERGCKSGFLYKILDNSTARITGLAYADLPSDTETLQIPAEIAGYPVLEIGYCAFQLAVSDLPGLLEITVPDSVEIIAQGAFRNVFGDGSAVYTQAEKAAIRLNIPANVRYIGYYAYAGAAFALVYGQETRVIHLPESLEYISAQSLAAIRLWMGICKRRTQCHLHERYAVGLSEYR